MLEVCPEYLTSPHPPTSREDVWFDDYLQHPTTYLQSPMPSAGFEHRPYGTRDSVTNRCTGWVSAPCFIYINISATAEKS
ncbi:hypothetical protein TNCV_4102361 [Trichonephila clavipes]|nr:hypothetical protein TNCV_4102361 [Trichonephila clavipes]